MLQGELHQPVAQGQDPLDRLGLAQVLVLIRVQQVAVGDVHRPHALRIGTDHGKFGAGEFGDGVRTGILSHGGSAKCLSYNNIQQKPSGTGLKC
ncbi:hypothetical protein D3C72_1977670 [compost metagenome]